MPAEQVARNLAFVNWTLLAALAAGAFGAVTFDDVTVPADRVATRLWHEQADHFGRGTGSPVATT